MNENNQNLNNQLNQETNNGLNINQTDQTLNNEQVDNTESIIEETQPIKTINDSNEMPNINEEGSINQDLPQEEGLNLEDTNEISKKDIKKQLTKLHYKYEAKNDSGKIIKGFLDAYSEEDVRKFLEAEGFTIEKIKLLKNIGGGSGKKLKYSEITFLLTQLSTYLKAGIPLVDSVRILERQAQTKNQRKIFSNITYELIKGESFSNALEAQKGVFPQLLVNMIKTSELTGDLTEILDDMTDYYSSIDKTRRDVISSMTYPILIFVFSIAVVSFILIYIVPKFADLFTQNGAELPAITVFIQNLSKFMVNNFVYVFIGIFAVVAIYTLLFQKVQPFRKTMQKIGMKIPVMGKVTIYRETAMFTKTFASLLMHNVFITDTMAILKTVSSNEIYKGLINNCLDNLSSGAKISEAFKDKWAFPSIAYEMIVTGENTGRLPVMMQYVADYFTSEHSNMIKRLNTFIEPVMIVFLAVIVGVVIMSVLVPMFSFYGQVGL